MLLDAVKLGVPGGGDVAITVLWEGLRTVCTTIITGHAQTQKYFCHYNRHEEPLFV